MDTEIQKYTQKSVWRWVGAVSLHWTLILCSFGFAKTMGTWWSYLLVMPILGVAQHGLAVLFHEATHSLVGNSRLSNEVLPRLLISWSLMLSLSGYRAFHLEHHRKTGTPQDPELLHKKFFKQWDRPYSKSKALWHSVLNFLILGPVQLTSLLWLARPKTALHTLDFALNLSVTGAVAYFAVQSGHWDLALLWQASLVTYFWMLFYLRTWLEHAGPDVTSRYDYPWWMALSVCPHNVGYHWEHHENPSIPFYNLPKVRPLMKGPQVDSFDELYEKYTRTETAAKKVLEAA